MRQFRRQQYIEAQKAAAARGIVHQQSAGSITGEHHELIRLLFVHEFAKTSSSVQLFTRRSDKFAKFNKALSCDKTQLHSPARCCFTH